MKLQFKIDGKFITELARERLLTEYNIENAISLISSCTKSKDISNAEHIELILKILNGDAEITGTYPNDDYQIVIKNNKPVDTENIVLQTSRILLERYKQLQAEYNNLQVQMSATLNRFAFVASRLDSYDKQNIDKEYKEEVNDGYVFQDVDEQPESVFAENNILNSYLSRIQRTNETTYDDYGWLEPDGTYHEVEWGSHAEFARKYLNAKYPYEEYPDIHWTTENGKKIYLDAEDVLTKKFGWILIHNPYQGEPFHEMSPDRNMTKTQKEFLYDFYIERNMKKQANSLFEK